MGNKQNDVQDTEDPVQEERKTRKQVTFAEINSTTSTSFFGKSFLSLISQKSDSTITRPWSRISRKRWKESTLTFKYNSSKTAWPVTQRESYFLPTFPVDATLQERQYKILDKVANGAFGTVYRVLNSGNQKVYALKVLSKSKIIKENAIQQVKEEVQIQAACGHHTFVVNSPARWQTKKQLFIVSDFVSGGELLNLLESYNSFPLELIQLYIAQLALAIDFLHNAGVIYRDLKPENILLDEEGNVQLTDFGLSKWLPYGERTKTFCGTPRYMAPEILTRTSYGHSCDWWSMGVIACKMITGEFPKTILQSHASETTPIRSTLPDGIHLDIPSKDLLLRLLEVDPMKRLHTARMMETIAFYKNYNFEDVRRRKVTPNAILRKHYPNGAPKCEKKVHFNGFESESIYV